MTQEMRYETARDTRGEKRLLGLAYVSLALIFVDSLFTAIYGGRGLSLLIPTIGTSACVILCSAVGTFYTKLQTLRRRLDELEVGTGKNPPPPADPAKADQLRKLHISRLE